MPERIQDQIKTWEDICAALQRDPNALPDVSMLPEKHQKFVLASIKLTYAAEALNEGWEPNWNNPKEDKYYNYFWVDADKKRPAGFGFTDAHTGWTGTSADVGARVIFKTSTLAIYARVQFKEWYQDMLLIPAV
jgi:hypothetical protein